MAAGAEEEGRFAVEEFVFAEHADVVCPCEQVRGGGGGCGEGPC